MLPAGDAAVAGRAGEAGGAATGGAAMGGVAMGGWPVGKLFGGEAG